MKKIVMNVLLTCITLHDVFRHSCTVVCSWRHELLTLICFNLGVFVGFPGGLKSGIASRVNSMRIPRAEGGAISARSGSPKTPQHVTD